jgi:ribonuclease J
MASSVRIAFLGGLGEIGRNCMVFEQDDKLLLLDCGLMFPDADMHGIDLVLPDFTWLRENAHRVVGCVATHAHEDRRSRSVSLDTVLRKRGCSVVPNWFR